MTIDEELLIRAAYTADAGQLLPAEQVYLVSPVLACQIGAEPGLQGGAER